MLPAKVHRGRQGPAGQGFDPASCWLPGAEAIKATVREKIELFGSANKA